MRTHAEAIGSISRLAALGLGLALAAAPAAAQNRPNLMWMEYETTHFRIYYPGELEAFAWEISHAAERAYETFAHRYDPALPGKTVVILTDDAEVSQGGAMTYINSIFLYNTLSDINVRGYHDWASNVMAHEFGHIASLWRAGPLPPYIPQIFLGGVLHQYSRLRGDVLWRGGVQLVFPSDRIPRAISEGIAQWEAQNTGFDTLDGHRRMMLYTHARSRDGLIPWDDMGRFSGPGYLRGERVYNQGYFFIDWLARQYGEQTVREVMNGDRFRSTWGFNGRLEVATGQSAYDLYDAWRTAVEQAAAQAVSDSTAYPQDGTEFASPMVTSRRLTYSPDGNRVALVVGADGHGEPSMLVYGRAPIDGAKLAPDDLTMAADSIRGRYAWNADGQSLYYTADRWPFDATGVSFADLYRFDLHSEKAVRLTDNARLQGVSALPDGSGLVAAQKRALTLGLVRLSTDGTDIRPLTHVRYPAEARAPSVSPDGNWVAFEYGDGRQLDVAIMDIAGARAYRLDLTQSEEYQPQWRDDGHLLFSSDMSGIYNVYEAELGAISRDGPTTDGTVPVARVDRLTAVRSGAFDPYARPKTNAIAYTLFTANGVTTHTLPLQVIESGLAALRPAPEILLAAGPATGSVVRRLDGEPAHFRLGRPMLIPGFGFDLDTFVGGATLLFGDELGRNSFEATVLAGDSSFVSVDYSYTGFVPTLFASASLNSMSSRIYVAPLRKTFSDRSLFGGGGVGASYVQANYMVQTSIMGRIWRSQSVFAVTDPEIYRGVEGSLLGVYFSDFDVLSEAEGASGRSASATLSWVLSRPNSTYAPEYGGSYYHAAQVRAGYREIIPLYNSHTLDLALLGALTDKDVYLLDEFGLGGQSFAFRNNIYWNSTPMPGYDFYALNGERLIQAEALWKFSLAEDVLSWSNIYALNQISADIFTHVGGAWPMNYAFRDIARTIGSRDAIAGVRRVQNGLADVFDPNDPRARGMIVDAGASVYFRGAFLDQDGFNSFVRVAHGFQDPSQVGASARTIRDDKGNTTEIPGVEPALLPLRIYFGVGAEF